VVARCLAISLHDVAPATWPECQTLLRLTDALRVPVSLLVVPNYHRRGNLGGDPAFVAALRARVARGDEIALHGFFHLDDGPAPRSPTEWWRRRVLTDSEGEMAAIGVEEARERIERGIGALIAESLHPAGFVPPAWLLGAGSREALRRSSLRYTSTRDHLYPLPSFRPVRAPSLVYSTRSAWRRIVSAGWNERRRRGLRAEPLVRIALHPADARYPGVLGHWRRLMRSLLLERSPVLESRWLAARAGD